MANNQSLAVGLAVGIPSFLIITITLFLWYRNQQKQNREDNLNKEIDLELRDDQSFNQFQEELHRKKQFLKPPIGGNGSEGDLDNDQNKSYSTTTQIESSSNNEKLFNGSSSISSTSDNTNVNHTNQSSSTPPPPLPNVPSSQQILPNTPPSFYQPPQRPQTPSKIHQKSPSAYDFYETFIPVLPSSQHHSSSQTDIINAINHTNNNSSAFPNHPNTPPSFHRPTSIRHSSSQLDQQSANSSSNASFIQSQGQQQQQQQQQPPASTLESFAKQLNSPTFFEKLPSRAAPPQLSLQKQLQKSNNNSSSDLLVNKLVGDEAAAINDHYTFEPESTYPSPQFNDNQSTPQDEGQTIAAIIRQKSLRSHNLSNEQNGRD
ncbi:hypothetical protein DFJ63DRAFT_312912 [Scheffersomyces coipomensis]|uniref:uncharacterized protein n=1 Tax=Scheffersomyces coipomensis TaxID=1788519 RepID=UPI00315CF04B